jgi:hypothetical protein
MTLTTDVRRDIVKVPSVNEAFPGRKKEVCAAFPSQFEDQFNKTLFLHNLQTK